LRCKIDQLEELNKIWLEVKKGSEKAFYTLYSLLFSNLIRYVRQTVKDVFLAEDIVQDVFMKIWRDRNSIYIIGSVQAYIYKMAHHAAINKMQQLTTFKNKVNRMASDEEWQFIRDNYQVDGFIVERIEMEEVDMNIRILVETLPARCKEIFVLSRYEEMSNEEIAQKLNISVNTVRSQLYHALELIRQKIM